MRHRVAPGQRRDDPGDHSEHEQAEDVVDHRRAEDDAGERLAQSVRILQHAGGDTDARRGQHGPEEGVEHPRL